jgi:DNA primase
MMTVEEILKSRGISFTQRGKDYVIRCLNPEHEDRNPSLRVDRTTGIFGCFSCGYAGNLFAHYGETPNFLQIKRNNLSNAIADKLMEAQGLSIPANAVPFDQDWRGISKETFTKFEAFQHNNKEFIGRVVFPVRSITGKIVGFIGRHTSNVTPKYLNHPENCKFPLFPVVTPIKGSIILVEGIIDMLNLHDKGLTNAVCAFGVNKVTSEKINILKIQGVSSVDIFLDNDEAGQSAAEKLKGMLERHEVMSRNIKWKNVNDPGELTASQVIKLKEHLYGSNESSNN